jgi:hypothetical protein
MDEMKESCNLVVFFCFLSILFDRRCQLVPSHGVVDRGLRM